MLTQGVLPFTRGFVACLNCLPGKEIEEAEGVCVLGETAV